MRNEKHIRGYTAVQGKLERLPGQGPAKFPEISGGREAAYSGGTRVREDDPGH